MEFSIMLVLSLEKLFFANLEYFAIVLLIPFLFFQEPLFLPKKILKKKNIIENKLVFVFANLTLFQF